MGEEKPLDEVVRRDTVGYAAKRGHERSKRKKIVRRTSTERRIGCAGTTQKKTTARVIPARKKASPARAIRARRMTSPARVIRARKMPSPTRVTRARKKASPARAIRARKVLSPARVIRARKTEGNITKPLFFPILFCRAPLVWLRDFFLNRGHIGGRTTTMTVILPP